MRDRDKWFVGTLALTACALVSPATAFAQEPWTVTVTPGLDPLPIGFCSAIQLTVLDASGKDVPRNSRGARVTMADVDMAVTGRSVAGWQIDATHFDVCACQGGVAGETAIVTASYPAKSLEANARVGDVQFEHRATLTLSAPKGELNPPACVKASAAPAPAASGAGIVAAEALPRSTTGRDRRYVPGPVNVSFPLSANGSWYEPGPMTVTFGLSAQGAWYVPGPVTVPFDLSATGSWLEGAQSPARPLQPAPPRL